MTMSVRSPIEPSSVTRNFGTTNRLMPRVPAGDPGTFASTRCTMFSAIWCSPPEIHIFCPNSRYVPSGCGSARVVMSARFDPACGSDRHIVPVKRPSIIGLTYRSICSSEPCSMSRLALPVVSNG